MTEKSELIRQIIELQRQGRRALRQYVPDAWMNLNLTIPQLKSLFLIARQGSMNTKSLAEPQFWQSSWCSCGMLMFCLQAFRY